MDPRPNEFLFCERVCGGAAVRPGTIAGRGERRIWNLFQRIDLVGCELDRFGWQVDVELDGGEELLLHHPPPLKRILDPSHRLYPEGLTEACSCLRIPAGIHTHTDLAVGGKRKERRLGGEN